MASVRVAIHPHARFLFQPPQKLGDQYYLFYLISSFTWLTIHSIYNIYINIRVSDKIFILSRPPTYIKQLRNQKSDDKIKPVQHFTAIDGILYIKLTSKTSENLYKISLSYRFIPCITAGILMILTISIMTFTNFHGYKNRIIREERSQRLLGQYWSRHRDTTVDHPACGTHPIDQDQMD